MRTKASRSNCVRWGWSVLLGLSLLIHAAPVGAERASMVIDLDSGAVLHAREPRLPSFPASLTKMMTIYLLLEALASKQLDLNDKLMVSAEAANQPPVRLGLKPGWTMTLQQILLALMIKSANDVAVVAAEHVAGSEAAFAAMMTAKGKVLGMADTHFRNASGLHDSRQTTTALDMALLARALVVNFPQYAHLFSRSAFDYRGRTISANNHFISALDGARKLKTGFTCRAGFNLVASAERNQRRLIAVILGERNLRQRDRRMAELLESAFDAERSPKPALTLEQLLDVPAQGRAAGANSQFLADVCLVQATADPLDKVSGWGLVVAVRKDKDDALAVASQKKGQYRTILGGGRPVAVPFLRGLLLNRAMITGLEEDKAKAACRRMRNNEEHCVVLTPQTARRYVAQARIALERARVWQDGQNPPGFPQAPARQP